MKLQIIERELKQARIADILTFFSAVLLILLFGYAAASKLTEYQRFVMTMKAAPMPFMKNAATLLAVLVPLTEFTIVGMLLTDIWRKRGLIASFFLLLLFQIYIAGMLLSGLELPCSCGGVISKLNWKEHLVFNAAFMLIAIAPLCYRRYLKTLSKEYSPRSI
ncbi:hypothetical protein HDC92_004317 [Pedobacter sp. AK017]|uniref:MauE/DoxX family redox-associated membrane protein n=1 Tax=Pedobacter sp. AK017 TaxID=2723073 RepID=UPI00160B6568|nr:MauE/DoxX family redox-associated membrane protein [Pedobacter sp. AK017]MBB5440614.1 hypothetical protein [Pedobacter sp. AK017]